MKKTTLLILLGIALCLVVSGQKKPMKPWTEWSDKEAKKIYDNSAWSQTQTETDTSVMMYKPSGNPDTSPGASTSVGNTNRGGQDGVINQATSINYHIRLLSARPVRQAFARLALLAQGNASDDLKKRLTGFAEAPSDEYIVIAVSSDSKDGRFSGYALQAFNSATTATLKNTTYVEVKGGKKIFLEQYRAPQPDGLGAQFRFSKKIDGEPLIGANASELHFFAEIPSDARNAPNTSTDVPRGRGASNANTPNGSVNSIRLNMRYKVADMMIDGKVEY